MAYMKQECKQSKITDTGVLQIPMSFMKFLYMTLKGLSYRQWMQNCTTRGF